ncbi:MAG: DUF6288 domain-containing protein, partial [Dehalococcoidia bacterium]
MLILLTVLMATDTARSAEGIPDVTKFPRHPDGRLVKPFPSRAHAWNLGQTGARGWIWGHRFETTEARQILITSVDKGSPADGQLRVADAILGVNGRPFDDDARKVLARAITEAEKEENRGRLRLLRWRGGKQPSVTPVTLQLKVIGSYGPSAPWDCAKSAAITRAGLAYLSTHKCPGIAGMTGGLALLAAGDESHLPQARELARSIDPSKLDAMGYPAWRHCVRAIFLGEYYLMTRDETVRPALKQLVDRIASGQSGAGTWGHGFANNGKRLDGYGAINQVGLMCLIALELGKRAGLDSPVVKKAIAKGVKYYRYYINRGSISYGDNLHVTPQSHDNNGTSGSAAIFLSLANQTRAARWYSRMVVASYNEREDGHSGNFWSLLWGAMGAMRSGPDATAAFLKPQRWYFDLMRRADGSFVYPGSPGYGSRVYKTWDCTGLVLLALSLPKKRLLITGRDLTDDYSLTPGELKETLAVAPIMRPRYNETQKRFNEKPVKELLAYLKHWDPVMRWYAAKAIAKKDEIPFDALVRRLRGKDFYARHGACRALGWIKGHREITTPALLGVLDDPDEILKIDAILGLGRTNAVGAVPALLELATKEFSENRACIHRAICFALGG